MEGGTPPSPSYPQSRFEPVWNCWQGGARRTPDALGMVTLELRDDEECAAAAAASAAAESLRSETDLSDGFPMFSGKTLSMEMVSQGLRLGL